MDTQEAYRLWRDEFSADAETMAELDRIAGDAAEIEDRFYTTLSFGTAGMRGVIGAGENRMNRYTVRRATAGVADLLLATEGAAQRGVVIAYDSRRMSDVFARETALVLAAYGVKAWLFDTLQPVPVLSFAVRRLKAAAGVVITASHNPPEYNGYKVYWEDGAQLPPEKADEVMSRIAGKRYADCRPMDEKKARAMGLVCPVPRQVLDAYIAQVESLSVQPELMRRFGSELRIVYTPLHGSGNLPVRRVLHDMGVDPLVVREQELPDGNFPTVAVPNPEDPAVFRLAFELADREGADVCFATDPDSDRLGVATRNRDGSFTVLTGNQIGCLLEHYILTSRKAAGTLPANGAVVKSLVSTELARKIASSFGVETIDVLTGFKFIAEQIQRFEETGEHTFLFGFEESYGYLSSCEVRDKDAVNASLLVTELALSLKREGKTLGDRLDEIHALYGGAAERVSSVTLPGKDGVARIRSILEALRADPPKTMGGLRVEAVRDCLTGIRDDGREKKPLGLPASNVLYYELEGGAWICIRPSGTEPKIKVYANGFAARQEDAEALADRLIEYAKGLLK